MGFLINLFWFKKYKIKYKEFELNCFNSDNLLFFINEKNILFEDFFIKEEYSKELNLLKINSINSSKSKSSGYIFNDIYLFGKNIFLDRKDNWEYDDCIKHIKQRNRFTINQYRWNDRYEWDNEDGSHHFAVANFLATNNKYEEILSCDVISVSINKQIVNNLLDNYEMFVLNIPSNYLKNILLNSTVEIINIKSGHTMVLFNKNIVKNRKYIMLLQLINKKYVLYFNGYLKSILY